MILQALVKHYEDLTELGKVPKLGWSREKISYALCISTDGELEQVICLRKPEARGKKEVFVPAEIVLPAAVKRAVGIVPNYLWDNASYLLGIDNKGKPERSVKCFEASRELHLSRLENVPSDAAQAVVRFFQKWKPETAREHPALQEYLEDILSGMGGNLLFRCNQRNVHEDPLVAQTWHCVSGVGENAERIACLVTGREDALAVLHPAIKGIPGAQSSGASLVSFNKSAFCSYGHDGQQGRNAPTGQYAAYAYGEALKYLLSDRQHTFRIGDTTVLCWAERAEQAYQNLFMNLLGTGGGLDTEDVAAVVSGLLQGKPQAFDEAMVDPERPFYILGLSPNAARLSVRFFYRNTFGNFLKNVAKHQERMEIIKPDFDRFDTVPLWAMLEETVNPNSRDKKASPQMAGDVLRAILTNTRYPATLLNALVLRIRADRVINRTRAAMIKAYYLQNKHPDVPEKEVLTVSLNPESTSIPYQLGRLFYVLENIQYKANDGKEINSTIKDKYFSSASSTPATVFPTLVNLAQKHCRKLDAGTRIAVNRQMQEIMSHLGTSYPARLSLPEQGAFQIGYYHQMQDHFGRISK